VGRINVTPSLEIIFNNCIQAWHKIEDIHCGLLFEELVTKVDVLLKGFEITLSES
jgi:hypothetical protein